MTKPAIPHDAWRDGMISTLSSMQKMIKCESDVWFSTSAKLTCDRIRTVSAHVYGMRGKLENLAIKWTLLLASLCEDAKKIPLETMLEAFRCPRGNKDEYAKKREQFRDLHSHLMGYLRGAINKFCK